jgi:hypothetical protein
LPTALPQQDAWCKCKVSVRGWDKWCGTAVRLGSCLLWWWLGKGHSLVNL